MFQIGTGEWLLIAGIVVVLVVIPAGTVVGALLYRRIRRLEAAAGRRLKRRG